MKYKIDCKMPKFQSSSEKDEYKQRFIKNHFRKWYDLIECSENSCLMHLSELEYDGIEQKYCQTLKLYYDPVEYETTKRIKIELGDFQLIQVGERNEIS